MKPTTPTIVIDPGEVEIGAVLLKDGVGSALATVRASEPGVSDPALVVRPIPGAAQEIYGSVTVSNLTPAPGSISVSNFPADQKVSGTVDIGNLPATQPVSGSVSVSNFPGDSAGFRIGGGLEFSGYSAGLRHGRGVEPSGDTADFWISVGLELPRVPAGFRHSRGFESTGGPRGPVFRRIPYRVNRRKAARAYHMVGRRLGFNSTSVLQDVAEFLSTTIDTLPELTGAEDLEIVSSSANDAAAGTGAQSVRVSYLDVLKQPRQQRRHRA